ncbi:hypothetical protein Solca_1082 [Solitalea canadensis DSM 3403]|uniref:Uncharacterized protein n=2 Tax=Solitalea canadensis TaxID=995 RepID=H8KQ20_SOLCM|nr:hypothetical protein Solca_1082 [Solitalea canadensis DSM 3403]
MSRLSKIESLQDLYEERKRLEVLKYQNELLIKEELNDLKQHIKPLTNILGAFSGNKDGKLSTVGLLAKGAKAALPFVASTVIGGPKVGVLSVAASLVSRLFRGKSKGSKEKK